MLLEVGQDEVEDGFNFSFEAFRRPVTVELADGGMRLEVVVRFSFIVPGLWAIGRLAVSVAHRLQTYVEYGVCEIGGRVDCIVYLTQSIKEVERGCC